MPRQVFVSLAKILCLIYLVTHPSLIPAFICLTHLIIYLFSIVYFMVPRVSSE